MEKLMLLNCAQSTRMGMIDQWPGLFSSKLLANGLIQRVGNGYQVTEEGFRFIRENWANLKKL